MTQRSPASDPRTRLALGCSALARAGQHLSTANTPEQARAALEQVAGQLEADRNLGEFIPVGEIAQKCREAANGAEVSVLLTACRQMATTLARRASSLAAEVQQRAKAAAVSATESPAAAPQVQERLQKPVSEAPAVTRPAPTPEPVVARQEGVPRPSAPTQPEVGSEVGRRLTIVAGEVERLAVEAAIQAGRRFARVQGVVLIDIDCNRMWQFQLLNGMPHTAAAEAARGLDTLGYRDWRLPTPEELQALLAGNGLQGLRSLGVLPAMSAPYLWTSKARSRFFGFKKDAAVLHSGTGETGYRSQKDSAVRVLAVRGQ